MNRNSKEEFSKSISYLFLSQIFIKILGLVYSLYLINKPKFGDEGNAIYLSGYQVFALALTFCSIGVPNAVSNLIAKCSNTNNMNKVFQSALAIYLTIACICGIGLFMLSDLIAKKIIGISCVSYNLKLLSPIIIITTIESIYMGFFNGIKKMKITAKIQFIEQFFKTVFTIGIVEYLSLKTDNVEVLSVGATLAVGISIFISFILYYFEKRKVDIYLRNFDKDKIQVKTIIKKLLKFSIPISIGSMLVGINKNSDSYFLLNIVSEKIGLDNAKKIYGIIASKIDVLVLFPLAFNINFSTALIPNISEAKKCNDYSRIERLVKKSIFFSITIGIVSTLGLYFFSNEIFSLLFNNSMSGVDLLKISAFSIIFSVLNQTFSGILQGLQKNKIPVIASIVGTLVKIVCSYILLKKTNALGKGIIYSNIISNIVMYLILYYVIKKEIKINIKKFIIPIVFSGVIMIAIMKLFENILLNFGLNFKIILIITGLIGGITFFLQTATVGRSLGIFENKKIFQKS